MSNQVQEQIKRTGVVPVIAIEDASAALPLADALVAGGLPLIEITFRTAAAADAIAILQQHRPELLLGAGTITSLEHLQRAQQLGAAFGVAPGFQPAVVSAAQEVAWPFFPGVMTPSEIELALAHGVKAMKFFPAEAAGGVKMLQAIAGPYAHLDLRFMPTGGVNFANLADYLALPSVLAVGGTMIAPSALIAAGDWAQITENCRRAVEIVARVRCA